MASTGTKTTIKLATLTAAAKDDVFSGTEDNVAGANLAVLANDPGSASLYSVCGSQSQNRMVQRRQLQANCQSKPAQRYPVAQLSP